jgi:hypothetical protein
VAQKRLSSSTGLSNRTYNILKWIAQIFLPAVGALYFSLSDIWGLPKATEVVGTITVVDFFLGSLLGLSASAYNKSGEWADGTVKVVQDENVKRFELELNSDPNELDKQDRVTFKVDSDTDHELEL